MRGATERYTDAMFLSMLVAWTLPTNWADPLVAGAIVSGLAIADVTKIGFRTALGRLDGP